MKLSDVTLGMKKVFIAQYEPGTGFETNLKAECTQKEVNFVSMQAQDLIENATSLGKGFNHVQELPEVTRKTLWVISGISELNVPKQIELFDKLREKAKNTDLGIVASTTNFEKFCPEVLKDSTLYINANIPPIGHSLLTGLPNDMMENLTTTIRPENPSALKDRISSIRDSSYPDSAPDTKNKM